MRSVPAFILLLLAIAAAKTIGLTASNRYLNKDYDGLILSLRLRAGFCASPKQRCRCSCDSANSPKWTIAGLWPNLKDGVKAPTNCFNTSRHIAIDSNTQGLLYQYWPCYNCTNSPHSMWEHEFVTHGACLAREADDYSNANLYFSTAISLYNRQDIYKLLEAEHIAPSNGIPVRTKDIEDALKKAFAYGKFELHCEGRLYHTDILQEIRICFDMKGFERSTHCRLPKSSCTDLEVWYLESGASRIPQMCQLLALVAIVVTSYWRI